MRCDSVRHRTDPFAVLTADQITWNCGLTDQDVHGIDRRWRHEIFAGLPNRFAERVARKYRALYPQLGRATTNARLRVLKDAIDLLGGQLGLGDEALRAYSSQLATEACEIRSCAPAWCVLRLLNKFAAERGIRPPMSKNPEGTIRRLCDPRWWRRKLRQIAWRAFEQGAVGLNLVSRVADRYASDQAVAFHTSQRTRNRGILANLEAVNEDGERINLLDVSDRSVANPTVRRSELMVRLAGDEAVARLRGDDCEFYTVTCPSRMHASLAKDARPNPRYDGTTPRQAQASLQHDWTKVRAKLKRMGIAVYGFRIAEPQHDGTPHWHFVVFVAPKHRATVREVFRDYFTRIDRDEPGAKKHRFKVVEIDRSRGSAIGYVAKYVSKNIDGFGVGPDSDGIDATTIAQRVTAWASTWGIRQFQEFGGPSVSVWRELRRERQRFQFDDVIEAARQAADDGDWSAYFILQGGPTTPRRTQPIALYRVWSDKPTRYGEQTGWTTLGVQHGTATLQTRIHTWTVQPCATDDLSPTLATPHLGPTPKYPSNGGSRHAVLGP